MLQVNLHVDIYALSHISAYTCTTHTHIPMSLDMSFLIGNDPNLFHKTSNQIQHREENGQTFRLYGIKLYQNSKKQLTEILMQVEVD